MSWIKLEDGTFAQEATPDPRQIVDTAGLQEVLVSKQREVTMFENDASHLTARKEAIEAEIAELQTLLGE